MNAKLKQPHPEEFYKLTQARLEAIKSQFTSTPRGFKLKGKVCVITGAGSLQGIGCVMSATLSFLSNLMK